MVRAGNQSMVKKNNQEAIITYLMDHGGTSRADLAKHLQVSKPTISTNISELIKKGIVIEEGKGDNELGKKSILVNFNSCYRYVLGIDLSKRRFKIALGDLRCHIHHTLDMAYNHPDDMDCGVVIKTFLQEHQINEASIECIGIAYPGIIHNGEFPNILSEKVNQIKLEKLTRAIHEICTAKSLIKNDINLAVIGERIKGNLMGISNLLYISVDVGVGAGLVIDGKLYEGDRKSAGEIGFTVPHIHIDGHYVNIEEVASKTGLFKIIRSDFNKIKESLLYKLCQGHVDHLSISVFQKALEGEDPYCMALIKKVAEYLGITIANITALLDIEHVVIGGDIPKLHESILMDINAVVARLVPLHTTVNLAQIKHSSLIGAVEIAVEQTMDDLLNE
ncbi:ROK family transcriptional regulator [Vallitalea pronyensis]|uniref:ROK family transcriptional regulator n=1 Tax=Vallitalea pronyensis TaxID=1348613 RepID=A0A8J8SIF3_9FIRM|nr:ROK family transcriptional regulator [Vallitalea pronyensis]QUI24448.1 ROK family transcriptional regulator [Vallitalea pronyensis]